LRSLPPRIACAEEGGGRPAIRFLQVAGLTWVDARRIAEAAAVAGRSNARADNGGSMVCVVCRRGRVDVVEVG
jgi:hypothetical protein